MAEPFIGQIQQNGFNFAPEKWASCEGAVITISSNQALFSLLGTAYGGDGRTDFGLPDFRGKVPVSQGIRPGTVKDLKMGNTFGKESQILKDSNLPSHYHLATFAETSGPIDFEFYASTEVGESHLPFSAAFLGAMDEKGAGGDDFLYKSNPTSGSTVSLGGVSLHHGVTKGGVTIADNGSNEQFSILQTGIVISFSIALQGLFPSRN